MRRTVWVMSRNASVSGVPVATLRMLRWARHAIDADFYVILLHGGPLIHELSAAATGLVCLEPGDHVDPGATFTRAARKVRPEVGSRLGHRRWRSQVASLPQPDVVLAQGAGGIELLNAAPSDAPTVIHLHEGALGLTRSLPTEAHRSALGRAVTIMVADQSCMTPAREIGGINRDMWVIPGVIDTTPVPTTPGMVGEDTVLGMGTPGWRKGTDRFVAVAHGVRAERPTSQFHWAGGMPAGPWSDAIDVDPPTVQFHAASSEPWTAVEAGIAFLPSREDPLPLVALEAGQRRLAVVGADTGGLPSLLAEHRGCVVAGHDLGGARDVIIDLMSDRSRRLDLGDALAAHVHDRFTVERVGPQWWDMLVDAAAR